VVIVFPLAIVLVPVLKRYAGELPPPTFWETAAAAVLDTALVVFVPWILLSGRVPPRRLLPSGVLFAALMLVVRPASARWLPQALQASADRYGTFGVAFTYLAWLYVVSWCLLAASAVGQVLTTDPGWLGRVLRGERTRASGPGRPGTESPGTGEAGPEPATHAGPDPVRPPHS
jgi:membrane protein